MDLTERIARDSLPLTIVGLVGRAVGMMVPLVVARWFGADQSSDAFYLALAVPMFLEAILATALHGALGPHYAQSRAESPEVAARFLGHSVLAYGGSLTAVAFILSFLVPPFFVLLADTGTPGTGSMAADLVPWLLIALPFIGVNITLATALELSGHFLLPASLPIFKAVAYLGVGGLLMGSLDVLALAVGYLVGEILQLLFLIMGLRRHRVRLSFAGMGTPAVKSSIWLFLPVALGDLAIHVNALIDRVLASGLPVGELTALEYADRVRVIPEAVVGVGLLRVAFSHWSNSFAEGRFESIRASFSQVARWLVILLVPGSAALMLLRRPVVALLFGGNEFGPAAVERTVVTLTGYIPGIPFLMIGLMAVHVLWISGRVKVAAGVGAVSMVTNLVLNLVLIGPLGTLGLSMATSLNQALVAGALIVLARQTLGPVLGLKFWVWAASVTTVTLAIGEALIHLVGIPGQDWVHEVWRILAIGGVLGLEIGVLMALFGSRRRRKRAPSQQAVDKAPQPSPPPPRAEPSTPQAARLAEPQ